MKIAFCLFKYFPFGGLQNDFMDVARLCLAAGHEVYVYTRQWQGDIPHDMTVRVIPSRAWANHVKYERYYQQARQYVADDQINCVVGFNKMPGLDIYFASDPSYKIRPHSWLQRLSRRYHHFMRFEEAVFAADSRTQILILSEAQQREYQQAWQTPDSRFTFMPPGIHQDACANDSAEDDRSRIRKELGILEDELLLLMIGSGFRTKGLDRSLLAIKTLPDVLREKVRLFVIGQDKAKPFEKMAAQMGLSQQVKLLPGRNDIAAVMQAGDLLLHPAYREVAGKVILEAVVAGLPVIVTDVCGYAQHVSQADAGVVLASPFKQQEFNQQLKEILQGDERPDWRANGIRYGQTEALYGMAQTAADAIIDHCQHKMGSS